MLSPAGLQFYRPILIVGVAIANLLDCVRLGKMDHPKGHDTEACFIISLHSAMNFLHKSCRLCVRIFAQSAHRSLSHSSHYSSSLSVNAPRLCFRPISFDLDLSFSSYYVFIMSPLLIITSFDQSMTLSDISLIQPPPIMLHRAVDARRKVDLITDHDKSCIHVSDFRRQLCDVGGLFFLF